MPLTHASSLSCLITLVTQAISIRPDGEHDKARWECLGVGKGAVTRPGESAGRGRDQARWECYVQGREAGRGA